MSTGWVAAFAVGWVVLVLLVAVVLVLVRQVAELRERLDAAEAPGSGFAAEGWDDAPAGIALYDRVPEFRATLLDDGRGAGARGEVRLGGDVDVPAVLVFHSPGCMSCAGIETTLERAAATLGASLAEVRVLSVLAIDDRPAERHLREHALSGVASVRYDDLPASLHPDATPTLVGIGRGGLVTAVGQPRTAADVVEAARACDAPVLTADTDAVRVTEWGQTVPFWEDPSELADAVRP